MQIERLFPLVIIAALLAVFVAIALLAWWFDKKRREALRQLAEQLNLDYDPQALALPLADLAPLHLFQQGQARKAANLLRGRTARDDFLLFDYRYTTGSGKNRHTHRQSVAAFPLVSRSLPEFELRPESVFHKLAAAFGYQDIDFPDAPSFSARYLVRGKDEPAVRDLFRPTVLEALETVRGLSIEGAGPWLIIYRAGRQLNASQIPDFLEEARTLRAAFTRQRPP